MKNLSWSAFTRGKNQAEVFKSPGTFDLPVQS